MTILLTIWRLITGNPIARAIGGALVAIAGILTFGAIKKREGAQAARQKSDAAALKKTVKGAEDARKGRAEANEKLRQGQTPEEIVRGNDDAWS